MTQSWHGTEWTFYIACTCSPLSNRLGAWAGFPVVMQEPQGMLPWTTGDKGSGSTGIAWIMHCKGHQCISLLMLALAIVQLWTPGSPAGILPCWFHSHCSTWLIGRSPLVSTTPNHSCEHKPEVMPVEESAARQLGDWPEQQQAQAGAT
ncbi:hypothetical protein VOLCADRAFT_87174 [Volvox carteri f. nagariensis]|uniref:Uncharacterized protein n=1 Tax=Volvox carteri f. nagariensis TaxID=3068 RepID=D8TKD4_VOLCA|nr:uncharacterized protein VOLCADRAFT_87174 [Volvox carteri f. nagariensis]EFJ52228.1 hypothetical protein VOLCADRAFT_87174 [Volvox carteri f. nagariensis]|eukprot:XP_002947002.1 hypothetical protein VOLCADRAFT_87174 [Volvox carteri f. nagariensis]